MPPTKIQGFFQQFPWIKNLVDNNPVDRVHVCRLETDLLQYNYIDEIESPSDTTEKLYLLDEAGELVTCEQKETVTRKKHFLFGPMVTITNVWPFNGRIFGSTIWSTMQRLGENIDKVRFIVSYYNFTRAVILYKLPKGVSLK